MIKVSIIIPVYNTEAYLPRCLESVQQQTLSGIEVICLNDGSTDSSLKLLRYYQSTDSRIKIIDKKNEGLGATRNVGVRNAVGEYLLFLDSDDWIEADACQILYREASNNKLDILYAGFKKKWDDGRFKTNNFYLNYPKGNIESGIDFMNSMVPVLPYTWDKLWRRSFFIKNQLFNLEGVYYEDFPTTIKGFYYAKRVCFLNYSFYNYFQNDASITQINFKRAHLKGRIKQFNEIVKFADEENLWVCDGFLATFLHHIKMQMQLLGTIEGQYKRPYQKFLQYCRVLLINKLGAKKLSKLSRWNIIYFYAPIWLLIRTNNLIQNIYNLMPNQIINLTKKLIS